MKNQVIRTVVVSLSYIYA